jgi:hypothetical protein
MKYEWYMKSWIRQLQFKSERMIGGFTLVIPEIANQMVKISSTLKTCDTSDLFQSMEAIAPLIQISNLPQSDSHKPIATIGDG